MTEVSDQFRLDVPVEDALWVCREAVVYLDWPLLESIEPRRLVLKKGFAFRDRVLLADRGPPVGAGS